MQIDLGRRAIHLHQQQRIAFRVMRVHCSLGGLNGEAIHNFHGRRQNAGGNNVGNGLPRSRDGVEGSEQHLHRLRAAHNAQCHGASHAECPLRAHEDAGQIVTGGIKRG